jgi:hypothetical protein
MVRINPACGRNEILKKRREMMKRPLLFLLAALLLPAAGFCADKETIPVARLVYYEDPSGDMIVRGRDGGVIDFDMGTILNPGTKIFTGSGFAELQLEPNGTILKLSSGTTFELTSLQGRGGSTSNIFTLYAGKLRTVAAHIFGREDNYTIKTSTAVCGIRGTDLLNDLTPGAGAVICRDGIVEVTSPAGKKVTITAGQKVATAGGAFKSGDLTQEELNEAFRGMEFVALDPFAVPGNGLEMEAGTADVAEDTTDTVAESDSETADDASGSVDNGGNIALLPDTELVTEGSAEPVAEGKKVPDWLSDMLGFEVGTLMVDNATWSQVVLQPDFNFDRIRFGLYLPVIYTDNLFDTGEWYHPDGNDEWSFGSDQSGNGWEIFVDINRDFWLKLRYLEIGDPLIDPFYLKAGNLSSMTLGHGSLVRDYANDTDYPGVRRVGLNTGIRLGPLGLEFLGDDLSELQLAGTRISVSPIPAAESFRVGLSMVVDMKAAENTPDPGFSGDPMLLAMALDFDVFKVDAGIFRMLGYADAGTFLPVFRTEPDALLFGSIESGAAWENIVRDGQFRNFGINAGLQGNVSFFEFTLELRYENGLYRTGLFNNIWERMKQEYLLAVMSDLQMDLDPIHTIGIYGSGGINLLKDKLAFRVSYYWPWTLIDDKVEVGENDYFKAEFIVKKGVIPRLNAYGSVSYERQKFSGLFHDDGLLFLDGNAVLKGELVIPLTPVVELAFVVSTVTKHDSAGNVIYRPDGLTPEISPVINLETRIHF